MKKKIQPPPFTQQIREERLHHHWSQQKLADQLGTTAVTISRWENGVSTPSPYFRLKLTQLFGTHIDVFTDQSGADIAHEQQPLPNNLSFNNADEEKTTHLLEARLTPLSPYWRLPFQRNLFFTGREEILHHLHDTLCTRRNAIPTQSYVLSGLGGIGKTQIALEYAYRYHHDYTAVLWITAETTETLFDSFTAIANIIGIATDKEREQQKIAEQVLHWLNTHKEWLVIFDNVEDLHLIKAFLPTARQGALLFTSRLHIFDTLAHLIELQPLSLEEGTHLLLRRARMIQPEQTAEPLAATDLMTAHTIVQKLGGLPLALDQAGAYIEATRCSLSDYVQLFQSSQQRLLDERAIYTNHPLSVSKTFALAFEQIKYNNPSALGLLIVCAFLSPEAIPESFFSKGAAHLGPDLEALVADPFQFHIATKTLLTYSLLQRNTLTKTLTIHRLVQAVLKGCLTEDIQRRWAMRVTCAMAQLFPTHEIEADYWQVCEQLLPHAFVCIALSEQWCQDEILHITLLNHVAIYLSHRARYAEAEALFLKVLDIGAHEPDTEHPLMAEALSELAYLYCEQGKYAEAEPLFLRALHIREQELGSEHSQVAFLLNRMASLYHRQGKYDEAEPLFLRALHIREQELGSEHSQVASSLNNLAVIYIDREQYAKAKPLIERALHIWEQTLGHEHPLVAISLNNLAMIYVNQGKFEEAEPLYMHALHIREQVLGGEHPLVAYVLNNLAELYNKQERLEEATSLYQRAIRIREYALGSEHPLIAYPLDGLAGLYVKQGNYKEATSLYLHALHIREQALGGEHPLVKESRTNLAALQSKC